MSNISNQPANNVLINYNPALIQPAAANQPANNQPAINQPAPNQPAIEFHNAVEDDNSIDRQFDEADDNSDGDLPFLSSGAEDTEDEDWSEEEEEEEAAPFEVLHERVRLYELMEAAAEPETTYMYYITEDHQELLEVEIQDCGQDLFASVLACEEELSNSGSEDRHSEHSEEYNNQDFVQE